LAEKLETGRTELASLKDTVAQNVGAADKLKVIERRLSSTIAAIEQATTSSDALRTTLGAMPIVETKPFRVTLPSELGLAQAAMHKHNANNRMAPPPWMVKFARGRSQPSRQLTTFGSIRIALQFAMIGKSNHGRAHHIDLSGQ
jgi:hypothetical protein